MNFPKLLRQYWPILIILVLGGFLRLWGLLQNPISLFSDEVDIGYQVQSFLSTGRDYQGNLLPLQFHSFSDVRTALPIYATALVSLIPGVSLDMAIRLTPALFSLLGILVIFFLVDNLMVLFGVDFPKKHFSPGVWAALILTLIPWHLTYSRIGFELSMLFTFFVTGLFLYSRFLMSKKPSFLILSLIVLSLTPLIYSTAKLAIIFYPLILWLIPGSTTFFWHQKRIFLLLILFIPMGLLLLNKGAAQRFSEISILTDPTTPTEVNYQRLLDSGPGAPVGVSPSITSRLLHNKPLWYADKFVKNIFGLLSTDFLFTRGDPNLRHSPAGSGMLYSTLLPVIVVGFYFLIKNRHEKFLYFLLLLTIIPLATSAITRDGGNHASRSFMFLLPLVIISGLGLFYLFQQQKILAFLLLCLISFETVFFVHDYWYHYRYASERSWSAGMRELMHSVQNYPDQPVVISPKNEYPLIFYLYYTGFDPARFQSFKKNDTVYQHTFGENNLEGNRIGDSNLYIATLLDYQDQTKNTLPQAVYFLTREEVTVNNLSLPEENAIIRLPSGEPLYYELHL